MLKNKKMIIEVNKTEKISKSKHGRLLYYTGRLVKEIITMMVYIEMLRFEGVNSISQARLLIESTSPNKFYNYGSNKFEGNNEEPEELKELRGGFFSLHT